MRTSPRPRWSRGCPLSAKLLVLTSAAALLFSPAARADTVIDFDGLQAGDVVANQYHAQGIDFSDLRAPEIVVTAVPGAEASSGTHVLNIGHGQSLESTVSGTLTAPASSLSFAIGLFDNSPVQMATGTLTLTVFDANGAHLGETSQILPSQGTGFHVVLALSRPQPDIRSFTLVSSQDDLVGIDDVTFDQPVVGPSTFALTVQVSGAGTVTGQGISCPIACTGVYAAGTSVSLSASPTVSAGSAFGGWSGDCVGGVTTCTLVLDKDRSAAALFSGAAGQPSGAAPGLASTLTHATFAARWVRSRVSGTLAVGGTVPKAGTYALKLKRGNATAFERSFKLPEGAFSHKFELPARLLPGAYHVALVPSMSGVQTATFDAKLGAPAEGVVDRAFIAAAPNGPATLTIGNPRKLWANFHFAALPQGNVTLTWYRLGRQRTLIGSVIKPRASKVLGFVGPAKFDGTYQAVVSRKGVVIARAVVKVFNQG